MFVLVSDYQYWLTVFSINTISIVINIDNIGHSADHIMYLQTRYLIADIHCNQPISEIMIKTLTIRTLAPPEMTVSE